MPRILIVGAGYGGIFALKTLTSSLKPSDQTDVVVMEKSAYFFHALGSSRCFTEASFVKNMFIPYDHVIPTKAQGFARLIRAMVTEISSDKVTYKLVDMDGTVATETQTMAVDYLVLATGSTNTVPIKPDTQLFSRTHTEQKMREVHERILHANKILVVGGGGVGCEVASEIKVEYPEKKVILLASRNHLLPSDNISTDVRERVLVAIKAVGVEVILGERLPQRLTHNSYEKCTLVTDKGTEIESDVQLWCTGFSPSGELVHAMDASLVDASGAIRVNDKLQLDKETYKHIFAIGDATNHSTPKKANYAADQARYVAHQLVSLVRGTQSEVLKPFPLVKVQTLVLPIGPHRGVTQLPLFGGWVLGDWTTRLIKGRDMMAGRMWSELGATMPP